jgi:ABC-2 type transport system ATP-binding protein
VIPTPPAAFSPLATTKSGWCSSRRAGSRADSVRLPRPPTTSPMNRSFTRSDSANLRSVETGTRTATTIAAHDLVKRYGERVALRGVSLSAGRGELMAVIGPNGAGKTTLLSILAGIQQPDEGRVEAAADLGWVPQQAALYSKLTVEENLTLFARLERCDDLRDTVQRMLDLTGLGDRAGDQVGTLSGGNRQRVNIAIGLLAAPEVLLLDEPSSALDPRQRERLWEFILRLAQDGTTVLYATHHIQEADRYADRLIVLADGENLFAGPPRELEQATGTTGLDFEQAFVQFLHQRGH